MSKGFCHKIVLMLLGVTILKVEEPIQEDTKNPEICT